MRRVWMANALSVPHLKDKVSPEVPLRHQGVVAAAHEPNVFHGGWTTSSKGFVVVRCSFHACSPRALTPSGTRHGTHGRFLRRSSARQGSGYASTLIPVASGPAPTTQAKTLETLAVLVETLATVGGSAGLAGCPVRAAAAGRGWPERLRMLLALLHYAENARANIADGMLSC